MEEGYSYKLDRKYSVFQPELFAAIKAADLIKTMESEITEY